MKYQLYKRTFSDEAEQAIAIIGHHESDEINKFEVFRITNGTPVNVEVFINDDIKIYGEGRPLWSEITWERNGKWDVINTGLNLEELATNIKADPSPSTVSELVQFLVAS